MILVLVLATSEYSKVETSLVRRNVCQYVYENYSTQLCRAGWAELNGANAVSFVVVKHVSKNFDNFWQVKQFIYAL